MIIPRYWAEARLQHRDRKRQVTVRRFGWSDIGEAEAQAHADVRVREALERVLAGEALPRRERRVAYNGADGVPIREEIVDRHGDSVITRNGYGALCLNTPGVLFADIDFERASGIRPILLAMACLLIIVSTTLTVGFGIPLPLAAIIALVVAVSTGWPLLNILRRISTRIRGGNQKIARDRIATFLAGHPDWRVRIYRTPAGLRMLALHRLFDPREPAVQACFDALGVDPIYARMCHNQHCFRARVSPKPWRMGMPRMRPPYSAAWRPEHAHLPARLAWIDDYQREAQGYASCRYIETLGDGPVDSHADAVRELHDLLCQAERDLAIA